MSAAVAMRIFAGVVVISATALLVGADVAASPDRLVSRWRLSLQGTQGFEWEVTSSFDTAGGGNCTIRHAGDQTIRFETPSALPVKIVPGDSPTVTSDAQAHAYVRGRLRGIVPLRGSERRAHRVLELRPNRDACVNDPRARRSASDCGATTPLADTGTFVYFKAMRSRPEVEWHKRLVLYERALPRDHPRGVVPSTARGEGHDYVEGHADALNPVLSPALAAPSARQRSQAPAVRPSCPACCT